MNSEQTYYCDKCGYASKDPFVIEYHESVPNPPALPVKIGDRIWVQSHVRSFDKKLFVPRVIVGMTVEGTTSGVYHVWRIELDQTVVRQDADDYVWETNAILNEVIKTTDGQSIDMLQYKIQTLPSLLDLKKRKISFYRDFSG